MFTKKTRLISLLVTISMLISMVTYFSITVTADTTGATEIDSVAELKAIANDLDGNYILTGDINLTGTDYDPIGSIDAPFTGTFDGNGYTISGLTLNTTDNFVGLFGVNNGTIRNVTIADDCVIKGNAYVGAVAGKNNGTVENCISEATVGYVASSTVGGTYKVMTQNLCQWGDLDFALSKNYENAATQITRRPGMLTRIKTADPDLIAFQENSFTDLTKYQNDAEWWESLFGTPTSTVKAWNTYLKANLTGYTFFGSQGSLTATPNEGATVAYKTDRFNQLAAGTFWHSTNPDAPIDQQDANWDVVQSGGQYDGEKWGFGAGNKRVVNWVALEDETTAQKIVLYSLHPQHDSEEVRRKEIPVLLAKMDALRATYPDAIFIAAGDYNASKGAGSYNLVENYLNGEMDNVRDIAEETLNGSEEKGTCGGGIFDNTMSGTIDHIFVDGSAAAVKTYEILDGVYNSAGVAAEWDENVVDANGCTTATALRPSDHNGVVATIETRTNYAIGGVVGENEGKVGQIVSKATVPSGHGTAIGVNTKTAVAVYGTGTVVGEGNTAGAAVLPAKANFETVWKLNHAAGESVFAIVDDDYKILLNGESAIYPVRITVNSKHYYNLPGTTFDLASTGIPDPMLIIDGEVSNQTSILVEKDIDVAIATSIQNIDNAIKAGVVDYVVSSAADLEFADQKLSLFNTEEATLYMGDDIDLTGSTFDGFGGKIYFSFDGLGKTIKNWTTNSTAFFNGTTGNNGFRGEYVKNVTFDNVHTRGGYGRSIVVCMGSGANDFLMENVHVKNSSVTITTGDNLAAILYTNTHGGAEKRTVTIRGCSVIDSVIQVEEGRTNTYTNSGAVSGRIGNGVTYNISDIYVKGFENKVGLETTGSKGNSVLIGTRENGGVLTLKNIGIFDCSTSGQGYDLIGRQYDSVVNVSNVVTAGNQTSGLTAKEGGTITFDKVYTTATNKVATMDAKANDGLVIEGGNQTSVDGVTDIAARADLKTGAHAYGMNKAHSNPYFYWKVDESNNDGALKLATFEQQTRKVTVVAPDGAESVSYANGGSTIELAPIEGQYPYIAKGNGSINGIALLEEGESAVDSLVVSTDQDTVVRYVDESSDAYQVVLAIGYFEGKNLAYYSDADLAAKLDVAKEKLADGAYATDTVGATAMKDALTAAKAYNTTPNADGSNMPSVAEIDTYSDAVNFVVRNVDEFVTLCSVYKTKLDDAKYTIHLACDLDFSDAKIKSFTGFLDAKFSTNGHGHTIRNWGTSAARISTRGFFYNTYGGVAHIKSIKNLNFENCHTVTTSTGSAILYGIGHANAAMASTAEPNLTLSGIHFTNCSMDVNGYPECVSFLLARYGVQSKAVQVKISDCSVIGSTIDAKDAHAVVDGKQKDAAHIGFLVGKPRIGTSGTATYDIKDCYLANNEIIDCCFNAGFIFGCAENGSTVVNVNNVGVVNNKMSSVEGGEVGLAGNSAGGKVNLTDVFFQDNIVDSPNVYVVSGGYNAAATDTAAGSATNVYHNNEGLKSAYENVGATGVKQKNDVFFADGTVAGEINAGTTEQTLYWTTNENGKIEPSALADSTHKAVLKLANGKVVGEAYANGGEQVTLKVDADPDATFSGATAGSLSGNVLTMPTNGAVVTVTVTPSGNQFDYMGYPAVSTVKAALAAGGNYTIYNEADWDYLETNISYFQRQDITIHLAADIDLSKISFAGFQEPSFSFDGHNHTVSGWGSTAVYATATAMFIFDGAAANGGANFIKNLNIENCYVSGRAILVGGVASNGGFAGLSTNFTVENVHIKNSGLKGNTNFNAFFIGGYASTTADYTVNLKNCSLIDSTMVGGGSGHAGMLIGKISGSGTSTKPTYNVTNIYMEGNTYTASRTNAHYEGMIIGNVEVNSTLNVKNLVAVGNTAVYKHTGATAIAYFGNFDQGTAILDGIVLLDNSISNTADASAKKYLFTANNAPKFTVGNVYCNDTSLVGDSEKLTTLITKRGDVSIASGEAAAATNEAASVDSIFYWRTEGSKVVQSDLANSTHKAELVLANGTVLKSYYANGGEKVILEVEEDLNATFARADGSSGSVSGRTLTMPTDGTVARVVVTPSDASIFAAYNYTSVSAVDTSAARTETNFTVANATEWMKVFNNKAYFSNSAVTIHLIGDINLGESVASTFSGFTEVAFAFDGHGHTISNWNYSGNSLGLFGHYKVGTLKNFNMDNCHVKGPYGRALIIGTSNGANAPATSAYAATGNITIDNVHIRNCSVDANTGGNLGGIFIGHVNAAYTFTVKNCSVIDTELKSTKGGITNSGIICGRASHSTTYNVQNLFVDGFMNNANPNTAKSTGNGTLFGTVENGLKVINLTNAVLTNCGGTFSHDIVAWQMANKPVNLTNVLAFNNDTKGFTGTGTDTTFTFKNVITDQAHKIERVVSTGDSTHVSYTDLVAGINEQKFEEIDMLTFAGTMNDTLTAANGYKSWTVNKDGIAVYATEANATRKVSYQVGGREIGKVYANGGSQITLGLANDPKATFALGANDAGTLDGKELTLPTVGYMVVPITVSSADSALATVYGYPSVTTVTEDAHRTGLNYTIANAAEWMHFFGQYNHFQSTDVTIHLIGEVDLAGKTAAEFYTASESALGSGIRYSSFMNSAFSLDGHGNAIKNWGDKAQLMPTMGLFRYNGSAAGLNFIKNLVIDNWHTTGSGGSDTTFLVTLNGSDNTGRNNLSDNLVIENVHIKNSSMKAEDRRSGFFVANYVKADGDYSVTLKNCSLTDSTLNGAGGGHEGLLIGKASSFNGKKATYNLINIYVARNIHNGKRGDGYVGLGIGNTEINGNAVAQMKVNMSNVVFEDNTLNSVSATPALFGQFVATEVNADGVVFENNTVTSTVAMTGRTIFTSGATTQNVAGLYHDDANVTKAFGNSNNVGVKYGEEYMTSGEAAAAANVAGEDSVFFYTTTDEGVDLCSEAEATRRMVYAVDNREVEFIGYANGGEEIEIGEYAYDPAATLKFEGAEVDDPFIVPTAGYMVVPIDVKTTGNSTLTTVYNYPAVTTVSAAKTSGDYTVANAEEWMYVANHASYFSNLEVTIHLIGTIDFSEMVARNFTGFQNVKFSLNGHDHTLKNWKPTSNADGLFNTNGDAGMKFIKNFTIDNADVKLNTWAALVFGSKSNSGNNAGYYANFELSGIHVKNTTVRATGNGATALFGEYRRNASVATTVTVHDCSFENVDVIGTGSSANHGIIFGRLDKGATFNIYDIYINNCSVTKASNSGIVGSGLEAGTLNAHNIGVFNSTHTPIAGQDAHAFCVQTGGTMIFRHNIFAGNTLNNGEGCGKYVIGGASGNNAVINGGSYNDTNQCDDPALSNIHTAGTLVGAIKGQAGKHLKKGLTDEDFANGAVAYTNNGYNADLLANRTLFWTVKDGQIIPADGNQTRKVTFQVTDGTNTTTKSIGYTGYDKKIIDDGISDGEFANYEWKRADSTAYTENAIFPADEIITASGVIVTALENALKYWVGKDLDQYFVENTAVKVPALIIGLNQKITSGYYQSQENAVPGLGFATLEEDVALLRSYEGSYQAPNETYSNVPTVAMIGTYADALHYTINSLAEFKTAKSNELKYQRGSTLHLMTDLDLSGYAFPGFEKTYFNFDGHNNTISNWTYSSPGTYGVAFIIRGAANSIKNISFDTVNLTGAGHIAVVYASHDKDNTNYKLADGKGVSGTLTMENIHVKNATVNSSSCEQAAIFLPNTQSGRSGYVFNNCSIVGATVETGGKGNVSGFVARLSGGAPVTITNSYIEGLNIPNGGGNTSVFCGQPHSGNSYCTVQNVAAYDCNIKGTGDVYYFGARQAVGESINATGQPYIRSALLSGMNITTDGNVYLTAGNVDNYQFNVITKNDAGHKFTDIFVDETTNAAFTGTYNGVKYPIYHVHASAKPDANVYMPTVLDAEEFTNGKAAWRANGVVQADTWLVGDLEAPASEEDTDTDYATPIKGEGLSAPRKVLLTDNRTATSNTTEHYSAGDGLLNAEGKERMGSFNWLDAESTAYTVATPFTADAELTLEEQVNVTVEWDAIEFVYNFGEWDETECEWTAGSWSLGEESSNAITLTNNGTVYVTTTIGYTPTAEGAGINGSFTDANDAPATPSNIAMNADGSSKSYKFNISGEPTGEKAGVVVIGNLKVTVA